MDSALYKTILHRIDYFSKMKELAQEKYAFKVREETKRYEYNIGKWKKEMLKTTTYVDKHLEKLEDKKVKLETSR